jgi:predicted DNA-binding transcriptional regulator AlpA
MSETLMTRDDVCAYVRIGLTTFDRLRATGRGPREVHLPGRCRTVRYRREDVDRWLNGWTT